MSSNQISSRFQLLFVDDQIDVAQTLGTLLRGLRVKLHFAADGEDAYRRCVTQQYDLVIIDLQMPPGRWGGLWLIRKLREGGFRLPILVLSGEAGQAETIEALRLNADDFVIKDRAQEEFKDRVSGLLAQSNSRTRELAVQLLPTPIAMACSRIRSAPEPAQRLRLTLLALEGAIRFTCLVGLAEARQDTTNPEAAAVSSEVLPRLVNPSMGTWESIRRLLVKRVPTSVAAGWGRRFDSGLNNEAIRIRNDLAHAVEPSDRQALELLIAADSALDRYLVPSVHSPDPNLVVVNQLNFTGHDYQVSASVLHGNGSTMPRAQLQSLGPVLSEHVYLWSQSPIDLFPLVVAEPGGEFGTWDVSILDGISSQPGQSTLAGNEPLRYIQVGQGSRTIVRTRTTANLMSTGEV